MLTKPYKGRNRQFVEEVWGIGEDVRLKDIAYKSRLSISGVAKILYGERVPNDYRARVLARVMGMKKSEFVRRLKVAVWRRSLIKSNAAGRQKTESA